MFKRATWLGVGFTLGVGTTVVAARKARQQLDRYKAPALVDRVTTTITDKATTLKEQVIAALDDGKRPPRTRSELRATAPSCKASTTDDMATVETPTNTGQERNKTRSQQAPSRRRRFGDDRARRRDPARRATPRKEACRGSVEARATAIGGTATRAGRDAAKARKDVVGGGYDLSRVPAANRRRIARRRSSTSSRNAATPRWRRRA